MSVNIYLLNTYGPLYGASATAGSRFLSYIMGLAFPLFAIQSKHHSLQSSQQYTSFPLQSFGDKF